MIPVQGFLFRVYNVHNRISHQISVWGSEPIKAPGPGSFMAYSCSSSYQRANKVSTFSCLNKEASRPGYCVFGQADSGWRWATTLIHCLYISLLALHECEHGQRSTLMCKHSWWNTQYCITTCLSVCVCINTERLMTGRLQPATVFTSENLFKKVENHECVWLRSCCEISHFNIQQCLFHNDITQCSRSLF